MADILTGTIITVDGSEFNVEDKRNNIQRLLDENQTSMVNIYDESIGEVSIAIGKISVILWDNENQY